MEKKVYTSNMEAGLRRVKVQCEQWRKAHDGEMYDEFGDLKKKYHVKTNQTVTTLAVAGGRALLEVEHRMLTSFFVYVHVRTFTDDNVQNASALESVILTSYGDASEPNLIEGIIPRHDP
ncbi:hypothetical protein Bca101_044888 [Brassica carinata]